MKYKSEKSIYWIMAIAFLLILAICATYTIFIGRVIRDNNHEYLVNDTNELASNVDLVIGQGHDNIEMLSRLVGESLDSPDIDISKYRHIINDSIFDFVEYADADGMNHNITGGVSDASDRQYYLDAMQGNSGLEIIFNSRATHENLLMFYTPVYFEGDIVGSLIGVYQASNKITELLQSRYFGSESAAYLCTKDGRIFAQSNPMEMGAQNSLTDLLKVSDAKKAKIKEQMQQGQEISFLLDGNKSSGYIMQVPNSEWMLVKIYPSDANLRMIRKYVRIALYMALAIAIIFFIQQYLISRNYKNKNKIIQEQLKTLGAVADIYYSMHIVDLKDYSVEEFESNDLLRKAIGQCTNAVEMMQLVMQATMSDEYLEIGRTFTDITTVAERLGNKTNISMDLLGRNVGWIRLSFIKIDEDEHGKPRHIIVTTEVIDEQKKHEKELLFKSNNDELTGLYNRRAYEDDLLELSEVPSQEDFVYAAIDINGLKVVNDEIGHAAGDELIQGAATCLKRVLGNYGCIYRTGGDEFVAIFFAGEEQLTSITADLEQTTMEWRGDLVTELSLSVGYVTKREFPTETLMELSKIADQRMYQAKKEHYSKKGVDRRGQAAAHTALCKLYTKILKINITEDSYQIVNMDTLERVESMGFSDKISEWLKAFATSGQVHTEDLDTYLRMTDVAYMRDYFKQETTSLHIFYRRRFGDQFKRVMMELIPADDYSHDSQSLYLYVKEIDK